MEEITGVTQTVAGSENPGQEAQEEFEALIKGKYKEQYDARVQETVRKRLKNTKAAEDTLNALSEKYGITPEEIAALAKGQPPIRRPDARQVQALYPGFSMEKEMGNPQFAQLVRNGVDLRTAFEVVHRDQILPAAMRAAAKAVERKLTASVSAARPAESAMEGSATALLKTDVAAMTRADRADIIRRVAKGEKIRF